jgi:hypothetical protein
VNNLSKVIFVLIGLFLFTNNIFAYTPEDIIWDGYIITELDKYDFTNDDYISGSILIYNLEENPILAQKIVIQAGEGFYSYPSQFAEDNIIYEEFIETNWILPNSIERIDFNIENNFSGLSHVDVYSWISKSKFNGANSIFYGPSSKQFIVESENTNNIYINREKTNFGEDKVIGPVGFPVEAGEEYPGEIYITNETNNNYENLQIEINVCSWSTAFCDEDEIKQTINIDTIEANSTQKIDILLNAHDIPSAYAINMKLKQNEEILSIYKNRVIVSGGTAKIRKIVFDGLKEKDYKIFALIAGSPDHFNYPDFENFDKRIEIFLEEELVEEDTTNVDVIATGEIQDFNYNIQSLNFDRICLNIEKNNVLYDRECFDVELQELQEAYDEKFPEELLIKTDYDEEKELLDIELSKIINPELNLRIRIISSNETLIEEEISQTSPVSKRYNLPKENLTLLVDDRDAKIQYVRELNFSEELQLAVDSNELISCPANICTNGTVCSSNPVNSKEGACCYTACIPAQSGEGQIGSTPLILIISLLIILTAVIIFVSVVRKKVKK